MNKSVSIIIPCRNEEKYIKKCISSFLEQSYPKELTTIIISDGMSTDNTRNIISELQKDNTNVVLLENKELTACIHMPLKHQQQKLLLILLYAKVLLLHQFQQRLLHGLL